MTTIAELLLVAVVAIWPALSVLPAILLTVHGNKCCLVGTEDSTPVIFVNPGEEQNEELIFL